MEHRAGRAASAAICRDRLIRHTEQDQTIQQPAHLRRPGRNEPHSDPMDTLGTYVDLEIFYQYIWQEFEKYAEYRRNTAYLFVGEGMDELLAIAPPDFPLLAATKPAKLAQVFTSMKDWINL